MVKVTSCVVLASLFVSLAALPSQAQSIRASIKALRDAPMPALERVRNGKVVGAAGQVAASPSMNPVQRGALVALGVVGGLFVGAIAGGHIGAAINHHRGEDNGLGGMIVGAPVGAIIGGTLVWEFTK